MNIKFLNINSIIWGYTRSALCYMPFGIHYTSQKFNSICAITEYTLNVIGCLLITYPKSTNKGVWACNLSVIIF
ncbi:hypothetical protein NEPAR05_0498 [Nematocida parisii]|uniref:Uncharacterized protein n=1 Tax=Nematocida parisii (strain ERTm3) TaxID=935791 RepID=I3EDA1_NEMP3|nr:hypothetical protein NEQG_02533 [Nematocida parisii ERTm3]KAI5126570.1 hypothetical protein NEPAR08_0489 [Nematocida parisii]KAI5129384.1 hypothetical protein NEPAR03_1642 [Nematocida parisii]KAI5145988.1 hypothetical protein NEPAR07_2014 [Nematocida parisii]KAI5156368.1 hypothetical protein NEPAR05_0498 [Nematocida parisii]